MPAKATIPELPSPVQLAGQFLKYEFRALRSAQQLHLHREVVRRRAKLPATAAADVRAEFMDAIAADKRQIEIEMVESARLSR